jgi:hypothetical protein
MGPMGWDGMTCESHGMGWDENFFLRIPWDGTGRFYRPHGMISSSHPIPFGALIEIFLQNKKVNEYLTEILERNFEFQMRIFD